MRCDLARICGAADSVDCFCVSVAFRGCVLLNSQANTNGANAVNDDVCIVVVVLYMHIYTFSIYAHATTPPYNVLTNSWLLR